ncbi:MAG: metal dependent phosphohydrolase [Fibrobacteres bacterium]|nr:metal dependent phosphohydrolase [Fibrobacterota bacterium]
MSESDFGNPETFFKNHGGVPRNPVLIQQTLTVLRDPSCSASDLVQVLEKEPAISSKVLKAANSVFFGTPKSITSLKAAIVRLGNHNISRMALSASLGANGGGSWPDFWKHSVAVAMLSRHIGRFTGAYTNQEEEELFSMGLLHDLGAMVEMGSGEFPRVAQTLKTGPVTLSEAESMVFGFDHGRLGRIVAEQWNFPGDLVDAIAYHHQPELSKDFYRKVIVVHLADLVAHGFQMTNIAGEAAPPTQEAYLQEFSLPVEQLMIFGDWLLSQKNEIDAFGDMMGA